MSKYLRPDESANRPTPRVRSTAQNSQRARNAFVMAIIAAAVLLLVLSTRLTRRTDITTPGKEVERVAVVPSSASGRTALAYVEAVQNGDFEQVFKMSQWMQERKKRLLLENDPQTAAREVDSFFQQEKYDFFAAGVGATLTEAGIPDARLFPPDALVQVVSVEKGLARPILNKGGPVNMVVLDVQYPPSVTAPTVANETRVDGLRAALFLTVDGKIVKASVRGNARVYPESVLYRHLTPSESLRIRAESEQMSEPGSE